LFITRLCLKEELKTGNDIMEISSICNLNVLIMKKLVVGLVTLLLALPAIAGNSAKGSNAPSEAAKKASKGGKSAKIESSANISSVTEDNFKIDVGDMPDVKWSHSPEFDQASYTRNDMTNIAIFDFDGNLVGKSTVEKFTSLPKSAQDRITRMYKDYTIGEVVHFHYLGDISTDFVSGGNLYKYPDAYFVDLKKGTRTLVVQVNPNGEINLFREM
jgi:hypothetical protein